MSQSSSTAIPEAAKANSTIQPPVQDINVAAEMESDRTEVMGDRTMRAVDGGSPETPPDRYAGALGQLSGRSQAGMLRQLQRSYGNSYVGAVIQRKADGSGSCSECEKKEKEIQRKGEGDVNSVPDGFEAVMQRSGGGQPLDEGTRSFMESQFDWDFGEVKIHTDSAAAEAAEAVRAQAFTTGRNIYFGRGRYQPQSNEGKKLLAHELTHVVQQNGSTTIPSRTKPVLSSSGDIFEQEANTVANQVASAPLGVATVHTSIPSSIQCQPLSDKEIQSLDEKALRDRLIQNEQEYQSLVYSPEYYAQLEHENLSLKAALARSSSKAILPGLTSPVSSTLPSSNSPRELSSSAYNLSKKPRSLSETLIPANLSSAELEEEIILIRQWLYNNPNDPQYAQILESLQSLEQAVIPQQQAFAELDSRYLPVDLTYQLVGTLGGESTEDVQLPPELLAGLGGVVGSGNRITPSLVIPSVTMEPVSTQKPGFAQFAPGLLGGTGAAGLRFLDPMPAGSSFLRYLNPAAKYAPAGPNVYTRFFGPESLEGFLDPNRLTLRGDLYPQLNQSVTGSEAEAVKEAAFKLFEQKGISYARLNEIRRILRSEGFSAFKDESTLIKTLMKGGLDAEEAATQAPTLLKQLRQVVQIHAETAGATPASPLISLTEFEPEAALNAFKGKGTLTDRAYIVRVQIKPGDVGKVNEILSRTGGERLAGELEVVVAQDLRTGGPKILSITRNPSSTAPLGGFRGTALTWAGRGLVFLGAALTVHQVLTAEGPNRREIQGKAFGSFAGATALGAFAAGFCIGAGIATGGAVLLLCGLAGGLVGAFGGGAVGGYIGSKFD